MNFNTKIAASLVLATLVAFLAISFSLKIEGQSETSNKQSRDSRDQFPIALYDPPTVSNAIERLEREIKSKRYDNRKPLVVAMEPQNDGASSTFFVHFPTRTRLPVKESSLIIIGHVVDARAFLSNDRKNVYSEFTVRIDDALRDQTKKISDKEITVDRIGGHVLYGNGKKRLYRIDGLFMPQRDKKYIFFLANPDDSPNFDIISAYALEGDRVTSLNPLEDSAAFNAMDRTSFLTTVRREIVALFFS